MRHLGPIAGIASRQALIATAGYDNRLILWDARSRQALAMAHHDHLVNQCDFSHDGRWLVSASSDGSARVWSLPALKLRAVLHDHTDDVDMAVFAPDDRRIATCALDRCVRIFDLDGRCLHEMHGHTGNVLSLAWSADARQLVSSSVDGTLRWWDAERGNALRVTDLAVRTDSVEIGADGRAFAGDDRGRIALIDGDAVHYTQAHQAGVKKVALDEVRAILVSLSYDRTMAVWQIHDTEKPPGLTLIRRCTLPETVWARAATLMCDGRVALGTFGSTYATFDPATSQWDLQGVAAGGALNAVLRTNAQVYAVGDAGVVWADGHSVGQMGSLCNFLVATAGRVYTGGQLGRVFDAHSGEVLYEHRSPLNCAVGFARQGAQHIAVGTYTGEILILAVDGHGRLRLVAELGVYENAVKGLSVSEGLLFSVCASTDVAWHRIDDGSLVRRVQKAHARIANACCAIGQGHFASVGRDRQLRLWGAQSCEVYASAHPNSVKCIAVDDAHNVLATGSYGGTVALFDLVGRRWRPLTRPTHAGISSIAWDSGEHQFLAASYDGQIHRVAA